MTEKKDTVEGTTRVLVGDSVYEEATITVRDGLVYIEFEADDLDNISFSIPQKDTRSGEEDLRRKLELFTSEELAAEILRRASYREAGWQESYRAYKHWRQKAEGLEREATK